MLSPFPNVKGSLDQNLSRVNGIDEYMEAIEASSGISNDIDTTLFNGFVFNSKTQVDDSLDSQGIQPLDNLSEIYR